MTTSLMLHPYQQKAVNAIVNDTASRGTVVMACGTGKTIVAISALNEKVPTNGTVLFLVPSLALIDQLYRVFTSTFTGWDVFTVCSNMGRTIEDIHVEDLPVKPTTDPEVLAEQLNTPLAVGFRRVVLCTYQSIEVITELYANNSNLIFDAIVFDEAHHTVGDSNKLFATALVDKSVPAKYRLFLTATPKITRINHDLDEATVVSMDDTSVYGERLYTYTIADAIRVKFYLIIK